MVAKTPLNFTVEAAVKLLPLTLTYVPTGPEEGIIEDAIAGFVQGVQYTLTSSRYQVEKEDLNRNLTFVWELRSTPARLVK